MNSEEQTHRTPAEDRAALREELQGSDYRLRLHVFDALNRHREADEEEVPEMPESLRDQLVEQFGEPSEQPAPEPVAPVVAAGFFEKLVAFFQARPLASYGGVAAAACAVMFMVTQFRANDDDPRKISHVRGDGGVPAQTADVPVYLFPEAAAEGVVELMSKDRKVVVCRDAADFEKKLDADWAVAVDLERRVVKTFEAGKATGEKPVGGDDARHVLLGIRTALDEMDF